MHWSALLLVLAPALADWQRHLAPPELVFPADHGAHPEFATEWWYATGELTDERGRVLGFQLTIFRQGVDPEPLAAGASPWRARHAYAAHLALADADAGRFVHAQRLRRGTAGLAGALPGQLDAWVEDWRIHALADGRIALEACDRAQGIELALELAPARAPILHGERGLSRKGPEPGNASAYVSWTRLEASGRVRLAGEERTVRGGAWFDHEWGSTQLGADVLGWDWFGLRLDDGRELMLYRMRPREGAARAEPVALGTTGATLVRADGSTRTLAHEEIQLEVLAHWQSPRSAARYPARWKVRVPSEGLELVLTPRLEDCELDARASTGVIYWEGPVAISGSAGGSGYAELVGYAGSLLRRF